MARFQTILISVMLLFIIQAHAFSKEEKMHHKRTQKINKRVKMMGKSLENVLSLLIKVRSEKDQCEESVANMTGEIKELSDKIDNLGGRSSGAPHIDLTDTEDRSDGRPVTVDVTTAFDDCMNSLDLNVMPEENAYIWCLRTALWQYNDGFEEDEDLEILQISDETRSKRSSRFIRRQLAPRDMTQPPSGFRTRKEYRTLSLEERQNFHDALNVLYEDGTIDCFARVHRNAIRAKGAHGGPAFLPWHRAFLSFFEEALRQVDQTVSIPYWDSSIDSNMVNPGMSVMWDDEHLGTGNGIVDSGPFEGWDTVTNPLRRNIARGVGSLVRQSRIDIVMLSCRLGEFDGRWENVHNGVHRWIGGTMARSLAASDPVFYMHHAFVDYQWEQFRKQQLTPFCDIDPAFDYPPTSDTHHAPETPMDGMTFLINKDGIADYWTTNWYNYEDTPTCDNDCGNTPDIFCDPDQNLCVSEIRFDLTDGGRRKRQASTITSARVSNSSSSNPICKKNLYDARCPSRLPPPRTEEEYVDRLIIGQGDMELPDEIQMVAYEANEASEKDERYPPESAPIFFQAAPDESNDCRTWETSVKDLVQAIVKGSKVTNRGYSGF